MRSRDRAALALAPLFLRFSLALIFIWAGLGKLMVSDQFSGEDAAILANYGVLPNPRAPRQESAPELKSPPDSPPSDSPGTPPDSADEPGPQSANTARPPLRAPSSGPALRLASWQADDEPNQPGDAGQAQPEQPVSQHAGPHATAADFPEPVPARRYAQLVLGLHHAIHPGLDPQDSSPLRPLWPDFDPSTDYDPWPVRLAWAVALTELVGGILVGVGLLTRLGALGLAGVMVGAIWLTTIGPALQSGDTLLGFLPKKDVFNGDWNTAIIQTLCLCSALALLFAGPGTLSLDRLLVGGPPKPPPPKPPAPAQGQAKK